MIKKMTTLGEAVRKYGRDEEGFRRAASIGCSKSQRVCVSQQPRDEYYLRGFREGEYAFDTNWNIPPEREDIIRQSKSCSLGEVVGQIWENQVQYTGDISYDVGRRGGVTMKQYDRFEEGFTAGFLKRAKEVGLKVC